MRRAYREYVTEHDSPHVTKTPSPSFVAILCALAELDEGERYTRVISERTGVDHGTASRVLRRMVRIELADRYTEPEPAWRLGRPPRTYYTLTAAGKELANRAAGVS